MGVDQITFIYIVAPRVNINHASIRQPKSPTSWLLYFCGQTNFNNSMNWNIGQLFLWLLVGDCSWRGGLKRDPGSCIYGLDKAIQLIAIYQQNTVFLYCVQHANMKRTN
ncbi:MAG: hypothetical protein DWI25_00170 [Planctomycetota bacterium]|nr:MAG: hypothetical protein DWI25_00170 [Planctomycetota bacterium]